MAAHTGVTSDPLDTTRATYTAIVILTALAWYNVLELNFLIFNTFKRYNGLYFWSLLISSWGVLLHGLGFILKFFNTGTNIYVSCSVVTVGWYAMVTGQSVVLYSRIHLVVQKEKIFRLVLTMIVVDAIVFHIPTTVMTFGANSNLEAYFTKPYAIMEKIQMTAFSIQETIISVIYAHAALKLYGPLYRHGNPKPMVELLVVNILIICMDIALLGVEYANLYDLEVIMKSLIYSIKLKLEFAVLTELKSYADPQRSQTWPHSYSHHSAFTRRQNSVPSVFDYEYPASPEPFPEGIVKTLDTEVTSLPNEGHRNFSRLANGHAGRQSQRSTTPIQMQRKSSENVTAWISPDTSETELGPYPNDKITEVRRHPGDEMA